MRYGACDRIVRCPVSNHTKLFDQRGGWSTQGLKLILCPRENSLAPAMLPTEQHTPTATIMTLIIVGYIASSRDNLHGATAQDFNKSRQITNLARGFVGHACWFDDEWRGQEGFDRPKGILPVQRLTQSYWLQSLASVISHPNNNQHGRLVSYASFRSPLDTLDDLNEVISKSNSSPSCLPQLANRSSGFG